MFLKVKQLFSMAPWMDSLLKHSSAAPLSNIFSTLKQHSQTPESSFGDLWKGTDGLWAIQFIPLLPLWAFLFKLRTETDGLKPSLCQLAFLSNQHLKFF